MQYNIFKVGVFPVDHFFFECKFFYYKFNKMPGTKNTFFLCGFKAIIFIKNLTRPSYSNGKTVFFIPSSYIFFSTKLYSLLLHSPFPHKKEIFSHLFERQKTQLWHFRFIPCMHIDRVYCYPEIFCRSFLPFIHDYRLTHCQTVIILLSTHIYLLNDIHYIVVQCLSRVVFF